MFKSFTAENLASTWKHCFLFKITHLAWKKVISFTLVFFHNKINFLYTAFKLTN